MKSMQEPMGSNKAPWTSIMAGVFMTLSVTVGVFGTSSGHRDDIYFAAFFPMSRYAYILTLDSI